MKIQIEIPEQRIAEIMTAAVEHNGMTTAWCGGIELVSEPGEKVDQDPWYARESTYGPKFRAKVTDAENGDRVHEITMKSIKTGLGIMKRDYARHFYDLVSGNDDEVTADVFLQCVALGEVVYG